jgi:hypothetical protein
MDALPSQKSFAEAHNPDRGADHIAPDCAGQMQRIAACAIF